ncbi:ACP S-malonyltransferase [Nonomuraea endophytica]|uniref:[acyl-carrier-protein] S-malonyltransferase n=1 Tax=Nonomuraea endophytica TaxID=714136 RepID=A0A7W8AGJ9_9ACTN|nr:ACP S-malonyltransferase [Nonomuraea endophytica]MBB5084408.1 [acyl-carrier-protein] S-malonyltransferase [Nonomuraea endophytica]
MLVLVAPGQGAQSPGFLTPWLELPGLADRLAAWSDVAGIDLIAYGTTAGEDEIKDTAVAQPLLVATALASAEALGASPDLLAGHSVGEFAAAALAGVLSAEQALDLVRVRAQAMAKAAAVTETGMTAILGGVKEEVLAALQEHGLTPANINGAGQIVAGGTLEQLAALKEQAPARARLIPLKVAGAFHTSHMASAVTAMRENAAAITPADPRVKLLSNADGQVVAGGADFVERLINQVSNPVRWDSCMATMTELGVTTLIELLPGGTLTGLAKRGMRGVQNVALKTPDDLDAARELIK